MNYFKDREYDYYNIRYDSNQIPDGMSIENIIDSYNQCGVILVDRSKSSYDFNFENRHNRYGGYTVIDINSEAGIRIANDIIYTRKYFKKMFKCFTKKIFSKDGMSFCNKAKTIKNVIFPFRPNTKEYLISVAIRINTYLLGKDIVTFKTKTDIYIDNLVSLIEDENTSIYKNIAKENPFLKDLKIGSEYITWGGWDWQDGIVYLKHGYWMKVIRLINSEDGNFLVKIISKDNNGK
jgi:hypothetical protein